MEDGNKMVMTDMGWTRQSLWPSLCHPYPWDWCEPWLEPRIGLIPNCEDAAAPPLPPPLQAHIPTTQRETQTKIPTRSYVFCLSCAFCAGGCGWAPEPRVAQPNV